MILTVSGFASHIAGGEISYVYLGQGSTPNTGKYKVTLKLYRDCDADQNPNAAILYDSEWITIYPTGSNNPIWNREVKKDRIDRVTLLSPDPCIGNPPSVCYQIGYYITDEIELAFSPKGYTIAYQQCCRVKNIFNVISSDNYGGTYTTNIPGTENVLNGPANSTPVFKTSDTVIVCANSKFVYDFGAKDADNDLLEFRFGEAYSGAARSPQAATRPQISSAPPYNSLIYNYGFSAQFPLGSQVSINPNTGIVSGIAPEEGVYVITVEVLEKRNGSIINVHRKDLHLEVANCSVAEAKLEPAFVTCEGLTLSFKNSSSSSLISTYDWDFGLNNSTNNISNSPEPSFTYAAPGNYTVRLITNKGKNCSDTAYTTAKIFPGFKSNFTVQQSCLSVPYIFTDLSTTAYGTINNWKWDFGNTNATNDTASTPTSSYIYNQKGTYKASLIVTNSIGCVDTLVQNIVVDDKPFLKVTSDTLICTLDNLQLLAQGTGTFRWSPNTNINDINIANPIVKPIVPTRYTVTLTQAPGCVNTASVFVNVKPFVSLDAGRDTTICLGDSIRLNPLSDGLVYKWSPTGTVSNPNIKQPWAKPTGTTRYSVFATIGGCQANDGFVVTTVPYPLAYAGRDTSICFGDQAQLRATGGEQYLWYPANTLNNNTFQNPIATPYESTIYAVGVYENKGCPKPSYDTVLVTVVPPVKAFAGNDTAVVIGQPMQLLAFGGVQFKWTPSSFLNNPLIFNPIAKLNDDIEYVVKVSTKEGCFAYDTVKVKVYKTPPEIFIPTAFTPNGDGLNDNLIPIPVGIVKIIYFKVYNRFGEMVFTTEEIGKGWNGVYKGRDQGNESFVWHVLGIDYLGKPLFKKGQSTLIR